MLFDVTRAGLTALFGADRLVTPPATAFPPSAADTEGARLLQTVGAPVGTLTLREPDAVSGRLPLVRDVVHVTDFENLGEARQEAATWPVIGWLLTAHLALDPRTGAVYAFDAEEEAATRLHVDTSSLIHVTTQLQRVLHEFTFTGFTFTGLPGDEDAEEADFERLAEELDRIRRTTSRTDPLPFTDDETPWSVIADEIATGQRFPADTPGAHALYG
ncbi:SUKH-4 family immunity protein [Streptomyces sp. NPDC047123]|uniref:SUKH-4 family immunity protein n=1 Tax=Streptomyces sp. NPDC047123 TaxID=3155622 RepID=UPI0033EE1267